MTWDPAKHPRIPRGAHGGGEFTKGLGVQTPSQFRHPSTGHAMGKSEIGDTFEELFRAKGAHLVERRYGHPYIEISHAGGATGKGSRTTALDFQLDHQFGGELKTLNVNAKNLKTAIKSEEIRRKLDAINGKGLRPLLVVQVVNMETGEVNVYTFPGFVSKTVTKMEHVGSYSFSQSDFRRAQQRAGHWEKRHVRAAAS